MKTEDKIHPTAPFTFTEADESPGFLLWQVHAIWQRKISDVLRPFQLTQVQYALLAGLLWMSHKSGAITQVLLARHAKLDVMMTSQVLRSLEARGLIKRQPHPLDTRAKVLNLTKEGKMKVSKVVPLVEKTDADFFAVLGKEQSNFNEFLTQLIRHSA